MLITQLNDSIAMSSGLAGRREFPGNFFRTIRYHAVSLRTVRVIVLGVVEDTFAKFALGTPKTLNIFAKKYPATSTTRSLD